MTAQQDTAAVNNHPLRVMIVDHLQALIDVDSLRLEKPRGMCRRRKATAAPSQQDASVVESLQLLRERADQLVDKAAILVRRRWHPDIRNLEQEALGRRAYQLENGL